MTTLKDEEGNEWEFVTANDMFHMQAFDQSVYHVRKLPNKRVPFKEVDRIIENGGISNGVIDIAPTKKLARAIVAEALAQMEERSRSS